MTKREEVVAAVEAALISNWRLDYKVQATAALDAALRVLGEPDAEMVAGTARAIAAEILAQDDFWDFRLQDTLKIDWLDQGEVDFAEVARAAYKGMLGVVEKSA